jgi:hypothetical protein
MAPRGGDEIREDLFFDFLNGEGCIIRPPGSVDNPVGLPNLSFCFAQRIGGTIGIKFLER